MNARFRVLLWAMGMSLVFPSTMVWGAGFGVFTQSASALGQANAVVSHHDSPSALFFNPALINDLTGTQIEAGTTMVKPDREFESAATGQTVESENNPNFPSNFHLTHQFSDRLAAGVGAFFPFGLETEWPENWEGRYLATRSSLVTVNVRPAMAVRLAPWISVAAGIDYVYLDSELESKINLTGLTGGVFGALPDASQKFSGDGDGWGVNVGILLKPTRDIAIGAFYRSEIEIDVDGDLDIDLPPLAEPAASAVAAGLFDTVGSTEITLPQQVMAGISYSGFQDLVLEVGLRWEDWKAFEDIVIELDTGVSSVLKRGWESTLSFNAGGHYRLSERIALLAGYLYGEGAVPGDVLEPSVPDGDTHLFSLGTELTFGALRVDLGYGYQVIQDREKNNTVGADLGGTANGEYRTTLHLVAASAVYRF